MTMLADLRLAVRTLLKAPGFTSIAIVTLGLGMTLCTVVTVAINAYLLTDLPYPSADRLYSIRYGGPGQEQPSRLESLDWRSLDDIVEHPIAWDLDMFYLLGGEHAESAPGAWVTPGFVQGFGIQPAIGRGFDRNAFAPGAANVALISHRLWTSRFGADPAIVGRTFAAYVSDRPQEAERFTIIGVMPEGFWHLNPYTDILAPLRVPTYPYMARLRAGVTPATAAVRVAALVKAGASDVPENWAPTLVRAHEAHVAQVRPLLRIVSAAAALVLLAACANVAGLLLVRAARRQREIAVRAALGAGRGAIARMLLTEGLVLGGSATLVALLSTELAVRWLAPAVQQQLGRPAPGGAAAFAIDTPVLIATIGLGLFTVLICTVVPLLTALRPRILDALQSGSRGATEGRRSQRVRAALIAIEVAVSLTLIAGSALMFRSVIGLLNTNLGFASEHVLNASLTLRMNRYPDAPSRAAVFERVIERVRTVPGVESIGLTTQWPVQQPRTVLIETGQGGARTSARTAVHSVSDGYFETLAIPLIAGRTFGASDGPGTERVAVISQSLARQLWPAGNPLGTHIVVQEPYEGREAVAVERRIVGIVRDVRQGPSDADLTEVYVPMQQAATRFAFALVRTAGPPMAALPSVRAALRDVDPEFVLHRARPLQHIVDEITARPRFMTSLLACFAGIAAVLALVGVYGVIAYAVRQREREIAVRLAVGADPSRITRMFVRQGGLIVLAGLSIGVGMTLAAGRLIESQLFGVTSRDPAALAAAVVSFALAGLLAIWWPARRAARTDPAAALRAE